MMDLRLTVKRRNGRAIAALRRTGHDVVLEFAAAPVRGEYQAWVDHGLTELYGEPGRRDQRHTRADDPEFLARLASFLVAMGFTAEIQPVVTQIQPGGGASAAPRTEPGADSRLAASLPMQVWPTTGDRAIAIARAVVEEAHG
jgi:hypothetical protein